jgi:hypothetical protein
MSSVRDIIIIAIILLIVGVSITFIVKIGHNINAQLLTVPIFNETTQAREVIESVDVAINSTDYIYLALFIGFFLSIIIFGWLVGGTTILAPIYFFIIILFTFVSAILQHAWIEISTHPEVVVTLSSLPITNYILSHLAYFIAVMGLVGLLVMYAKPYMTDSGGVYE